MTEEQAFLHLKGTFDLAAKSYPDIMEPWIVRLDGLDTRDEVVSVMRMGLAGTIMDRYPRASGGEEARGD